jgi:hypothetical protein
VVQDVTTVTSGAATFRARLPGYSAGAIADWSFATPYAAYLDGTALPGGSLCYLSHQHVDGLAATLNIGQHRVTYLSVNDAAAPPMQELEGAVISTVGAFAMGLGSGSNPFYKGITFRMGVGSNSGNISLTGSSAYFENCKLEIASTSTQATLGLGGAVLRDTDVKFAHASQTISTAPFFWSGGKIDPTGVIPTQLFVTNIAPINEAFENLDWTAFGAASNLSNTLSQGIAVLRAIKMPPAWAGQFNTNFPYPAGLQAYHNVGSTDDASNYELKRFFGTIVEETTIVKDGELLSERIVTTSGAQYPGQPCDTQFFMVWNDAASEKTVSVDLLRDSVVNLTNKDVVLEVSYPNVAGNVFGARATSGPGHFASASDLAASLAVWTTTGMANPRAQRVSVTITPTRAGWLIGRLRIFKASATVYRSIKPVIE